MGMVALGKMRSLRTRAPLCVGAGGVPQAGVYRAARPARPAAEEAVGNGSTDHRVARNANVELTIESSEVEHGLTVKCPDY